MPLPVRPFVSRLIIACTLTTAACSAGGDAPNRTSGGRRDGGSGPIPVVTATVGRKAEPLTMNVIGAAEAFSNVAVHPQITGQLTSVDFKEGEDVVKGEIIFTLDFRPLEAALQQAEANLKRDLAQASNARASAARYQDLEARGIGTSQQADESRTTADALDATVQADRAVVENDKLQLQYATIEAPISGRTGALMVHEGNLVRANDTTPLVVINQVSPIFVSFGIPEATLPDLKRYLAAGSVIVQAAPPGEEADLNSQGRITFIDNAVDPTTGQIRVKASFPNRDRRLWPGQFVSVKLRLAVEQNAVVAPTAAIQSGPTGNYVFVVGSDGVVDIRQIGVERETGEETIVQNGLAPGEIVVVDGQARLMAGSKVSVKSGPGWSDAHTSRARS
jgi:multidrug efflux system membrane fusion protein